MRRRGMAWRLLIQALEAGVVAVVVAVVAVVAVVVVVAVVAIFQNFTQNLKNRVYPKKHSVGHIRLLIIQYRIIMSRHPRVRWGRRWSRRRWSRRR